MAHIFQARTAGSSNRCPQCPPGKKCSTFCLGWVGLSQMDTRCRTAKSFVERRFRLDNPHIVERLDQRICQLDRHHTRIDSREVALNPQHTANTLVSPSM